MTQPIDEARWLEAALDAKPSMQADLRLVAAVRSGASVVALFVDMLACA